MQRYSWAFFVLSASKATWCDQKDCESPIYSECTQQHLPHTTPSGINVLISQDERLHAYILRCSSATIPKQQTHACANSYLDVKNKTTRVEEVLYSTSEWRASNKKRESIALKRPRQGRRAPRGAGPGAITSLTPPLCVRPPSRSRAVLIRGTGTRRGWSSGTPYEALNGDFSRSMR